MQKHRAGTLNTNLVDLARDLILDRNCYTSVLICCIKTNGLRHVSEITCNPITRRENLEVIGNCENSIDATCDMRCAVNHKFPSQWAKKGTLQAKCVIAEGGTTADWKTQNPQQTQFVPIPENCEGINNTAIRGSYQVRVAQILFCFNGSCKDKNRNPFR